MEDKDKKIEDQSYSPYVCKDCQGSGFVGEKKCPRCKGVGMGGFFTGELMFWGKPINLSQIVFDKTEKTVRTTINIIFLIILFIGLAVLGYEIYLFDLAPLTKFSFWQQQPSLMVIFWLSLLCDLYLFYRLTTQTLIKQQVKNRGYEMKTDRAELKGQQKMLNSKEMKYLDVSKAFAPEAHTVIQKSWQLANRLKHDETTAIHLFAHMLVDREVAYIFGRLGLGVAVIAKRLKEILSKIEQKPKARAKIGKELKDILMQSYVEAYWAREKRVEPKEMLVSLVKKNEMIAELLYEYDININKVINVVQWLRTQDVLRSNYHKYRGQAKFKPKSNMDRAMTAVATPVLDSFSEDLTVLAKWGYLTPCIDREAEVESIFRAMEASRNSVVLVGNPGVGKKTIVEGIAQRMVTEEVPKILQDKRLVSLSVPRLVSAPTPGEVESRLVAIIDEIARAGNIVLFIQDIQNISGISVGGEQSLDLTEVLAGPISNGVFFLLSTITPRDYSRYIETQTLGNVLRKVRVEEPGPNETIQIIEAKTGAVEFRNKVFFSYDAIESILKYTKRYIHDRFLPEKAINILEEVAVHTRKKKGENSIVTEAEVSYIISEKTKIPVSKVSEQEGAKLLNLETRMHERMVNQEAAVKMVASSLRRARTQLRDVGRPIVNLLFLGPTGVGKTELAKTVAEVYFGSEANMIRLDMSEYQDKMSIHKLIGAPTSGRDAHGGYLTEAVRKSPFSLVLLDEFEKAHPDILNIFLQVMDDGRLTDNAGRTVDFTNSIIIATSNAGTKYIQDEVKKGTGIEVIRNTLMESVLRQIYRPELLNRFDGVMVFKPLSQENVLDIAKLMLKKVARRLEEKGIGLEVKDKALSQLAREGYDPQYGARPLRRVIQERVEDKLANLFLEGKLLRRDRVVFDELDKVRVEEAKRI